MLSPHFCLVRVCVCLGGAYAFPSFLSGEGVFGWSLLFSDGGCSCLVLPPSSLSGEGVFGWILSHLCLVREGGGGIYCAT